MKRLLLFLSVLMLAGSLPTQVQAGWKADPYNTVITLYGHLTGKTILRPGNLPKLPDATISRILSGTNESQAFIGDEFLAKTNETISLLSAEFEKIGVAIISRRSFTFLLPKKEAKEMVAALAGLPLPTQDTSQARFEGRIDFEGVDVNSYLQIYSRMRNRTVLRPADLSSPPLYLRTESTLTKEEAADAMTALLIINGLAVVDDGEKMTQVASRAAPVNILRHAPTAVAGENLIAQTNIPGWSKPPLASELAPFYASYFGYRYVQTNNLGDVEIPFKAMTPMTTNELVYAISTAFTLCHMAIVRGEGASMGLIMTDGSVPDVRRKVWVPPARTSRKLGE